MLTRVASRENLRLTDKVQIKIYDGNGYVTTPVMPLGDIDVSTLWASRDDANQSDARFDILGAQIFVLYSKAMRGGGRGKRMAFKDFEEYCSKKRCVVKVHGIGNTCFFECLAIGISYMQLKKDPDSKAYSKMVSSPAMRRFYTLDLVKNFDPEEFKDGVSVESIPRIEEALHIDISVLSFETQDMVYTSEGRWKELYPGQMVVMLYSDSPGDSMGHYQFVKYDQVHALLEKNVWCYTCNSAFYYLDHNCLPHCLSCKKSECGGASVPMRELPITCPNCNLYFYDASCMSQHPCGKKERRCLQCNDIYTIRYGKRAHRCHHFFCTNCKESVPKSPLHQCYQQPLNSLADPSDLYIFYDYESCFDDKMHVVAGIVAMYMVGEEVFKFRTTEDFIDWVLQPHHKNYTCIAHNGGRYDFHFVKQDIIRRRIPSFDIVNGNTYIYSSLNAHKIRFIDSYQFIPIALRKFPETFGLAEAKKGYFPYRFFTTERLNYEGIMPPIDMFDFGQLSDQERQEALLWYMYHENDTINLYDMCMDYCCSDVLLLKQGCIAFRTLFQSITANEMDPFQYITIASVCSSIYRRFYMPPNTIAVLDESTPSLYEEEWLSTIQGEGFTPRVIMGRKCHQFNDVIYVYHTCIDIGCSKCYGPYRKHPTNFMFMYELRDAHRRFIDACFPFKCIEMRECFWESDRMRHKSLPDFHPHLKMRDAFFGGRTEPIKLSCHETPMHYYDYTSLYPSVQFGVLRGITRDTYDTLQTLYYPVGHPIRITDHFRALDTYFGFVYCRITPPPDLYLPLLPERKDGKLVFDNAPKTGTWTTVEVLKAVELGYVVDRIYEVVHFEEKSSDLFQGYVRTFLKIKQQAAGWAKLQCTTEEEKERYLLDYERAMGIRLEESKIESNPGLYFISKLCLNSLWGKFAQRPNLSKTVDTFNRNEYNKIAHSDQYDLLNLILHNNSTRTLVYKNKASLAPPPATNNIAIAAFTTSYARLRLYEALQVLGHQTLYMDTDSVIFRGDSDLVTGPYLGDLTNELKPGDAIAHFVACGAKSYAYQTLKGKEICKIKGFTLSWASSKRLNYHTMTNLLRNPQDSINTPQLRFDTLPNHSIVTVPGHTKSFRVTHDKREIQEPDEHGTIDTIPFNY
jgi:hypothetical protein